MNAPTLTPITFNQTPVNRTNSMEKNIIFILLSIQLLLGCKSDSEEIDTREISRKLYQLENQGWKSKTISHFVGDITYRATEVPKEYYFLKNSLSLDSISKISKELSNERIVEIEFEHINHEDLLQKHFSDLNYEKAITYMASNIKNDLWAVTSKNDTIACSGVNFERHFKVIPFNRVLIYFGGIPEDESIQLIYKDGLFKNGIFKFKFDEIPFKT